MTDVLAELRRLRAGGERAALATIVATAGSTPGKEAMKLLVRADGSFAGTVGGGCLEAEVYEAARDAIAGAPPKLLEFRLNERDYPESGLLCGGIVTVLVEAVADPAATFETALSLRERGVPAARLVAIAPELPPNLGRTRLLARDGTDVGDLRHEAIDPELRAAAEAAMRSDLPARVSVAVPGAAPFEVFVEPIASPALLLFGGGHVSSAIAKIARLADFRPIVIDDRESFASHERHPDAALTVAAPWEEAVRRFAPAEDARCVVVTRGHHDDERVLRAMAAHGYRPAYLGMIGSRTKQKIVLERLRAAGVGDAFLASIRTPIGLPIGARTHAEIAVSVVAELISLRRRG
ncbi:MAG TPA: XdhC family protein [Planctomycetota bacterium]|nr:XdhC family protein [Planctomycetota bacterium]